MLELDTRNLFSFSYTMNKRALLKRVKKRFNKHNHYYCYLKIKAKNDDLLDMYWTKNSWKTKDGFYILQEKEKYIHHTIKQAIKILKGHKFNIN